MVGKQPYPASKSLSFQNWYSMKSKEEWMDEEMRMRQSKQENPPNELLGRKCSPLGTSAEVASFSQGFLLSLGTSAELHLCQLDVSYDIGICWLAGSCFFQVVEGLVEVTQVVKCHSRSIECLEVLAFLLQHFEAVLFDPLVIHQLGLEQAGCRA